MSTFAADPSVLLRKNKMKIITILLSLVLLTCGGANNSKGENKMKNGQYDKVLITIKVEEKSLLFILLAKDGSINRIGDGTFSNTDHDMYIGIIKDKLFEKLMNKINPDIFKYAGLYDVPDKKGKICELQIMFAESDDKTTGFKVIYGSESNGPPDELREIIINAVNITEKWWQIQRKSVKKSAGEQAGGANS